MMGQQQGELFHRSQGLKAPPETKYSMTASDEEVISAWNKKEHENRSFALKQQLKQELNPQRHCLHRFFLLIKTISIVSAFNMGLGQLLGMTFETVTVTQYVLRIYVIALCSLCVLNELEWTRFTKDSTLLKLWITRGLFYAFIGVLGIEENNTNAMASSSSTESSGDVAISSGSSTTTTTSPVLMYVKVVAWLMVASGCLYTIMGCVCFQIVSDRLRYDFEQRQAKAKILASSSRLFETANDDDHDDDHNDEVVALIL